MREKNVILSILRYRRPDIDWEDFDVSFQFAEPFAEDKRTERNEVSSLYGAGLMSLSTAVDRLDLVDDVEGEVDKINMEHMDAATELQEGEKQQAGEVKTGDTKSEVSDDGKTGEGDTGEEKEEAA